MTSGNGGRTIGFAMLAETGHHTGTFRLARALRARGHRVVYIGLADFRGLVEEQGFEFLPFAADLLPAGYLRGFLAGLGERRGLRERWRKRRSDARLFSEYLRSITDGRLDAVLAAARLDVLLCDTFVWYVALRALRAGVPTINLSIPLSLYENAQIPPIVSAVNPLAGRFPRLRVRGSWRWLRLRFFFSKRLASHLFGSYRHPTRMHHLVHEFLRIARRSGHRAEENRTYWFGEMGPRLVLPELVLCPKAFQLPGSPDDGRHYVADVVDLDRREETWPEGAVDAGKPLVYCSLGTSPSFYPHADRFFRAVVVASALRPDWQFVLQAGEPRALETIGPRGPNLVVCERVPQLALLRRAAVLVTHGGLNSILEAVQLEVPMVIFPGRRDQPGNTVRAVHYGLALSASMARVTPEHLVRLVARAMSDPDLRRALARMKQRIAKEDGVEAAARLVEGFAGGAARPSDARVAEEAWAHAEAR